MKKITLLFDIDDTLVHENINCFKKTKITGALEGLSSDYKLGLFSQGFCNIQILKLKVANLYHFFSKDIIFISHNKLKKLNDIFFAHPNIIIIDNSKAVQKIANKLNIKFVLVSSRTTKDELVKQINEISKYP
ncbi:hypothetical protein CO058_01970 [candidate division WWE3 bacterium CG_4_9_14_0_2_um_filter_35_11]|uniref:FCP1 homology domain-containing protein n=1 Tax=candidate division WWE3 bacterium CG_4_9_14_0_2_um_filter_35_11 TaxID=1975077 RepID=A0A2M8ELY2_UNCKA|nr:MAG: hypothetical protein COV25_00995 [candidate division WWE3 bacterium CG10_big_fil_rev_8_21_14_0_10_35_32]PJC23743.1 MAG: hypothetical protein CO058_01970 [candidate division WWE3 bacterium CG_4_9_14_0_2_um_filter_35_11]